MSIAYDLELWNIVAPTLVNHPSVVVGAVYTDASQESSPGAIADVPIPVLRHLAGKPAEESAQPTKSPKVKKYYYPNATSSKFATPFQDSFHYNTEAISHTRNLTLFKKEMDGPYFDLETIWDEHTYYEFADRSVEHTMSTMVQEPYVNHVPTVSLSPAPAFVLLFREADPDPDDRRHWSHKALPLLPAQLYLQQLRRLRARAYQPDRRCRSRHRRVHFQIHSRPND